MSAQEILLKCKECKKDATHFINDVCVSCYINENLPTKVKDSPWVIADSYERRRDARGKINLDFDENLASAIEKKNITVEKEKKEILVQTENGVISIPITVEGIDILAQKTGTLVGKWLIYRTQPEIDFAWKVIAENTWSGDLGIMAKASTSSHRSKRQVICVYTYNYLDLVDVKEVREKLRILGFNEELCYKPDIYSYLGIYYRTASLSPCRYRM